MLRTLGTQLLMCAAGLLTAGAAAGCSNTYVETCGAPGIVTDCACDDNKRGAKQCLSSGNWGRCGQKEADGLEFYCVEDEVPIDGDPLDKRISAAGDGDGDNVAGDGDGDNVAGDGDGDNVAGDGDGDNDPPVAQADWANCNTSSQCPRGQQCLSSGGSGGNFCSSSCRNDSDCPAPGSGTAVPVCQSMGPLGSACFLDCSDDAGSCPTGMECPGGGPFGGSGVCTWP